MTNGWRWLATGPIAGTLLGAVDSVVNHVPLLLGEIGTARAERGGRSQAAEFASLILDAGWAWAAAAVLAGWLAATAPRRTAVTRDPAHRASAGRGQGTAGRDAAADAGRDAAAQAGRDAAAQAGRDAAAQAGRDAAAQAGRDAAAQAGRDAAAQAGRSAAAEAGRGAVAGAATLACATATYYAVDLLFDGGAWWSWVTGYWLAASVLLGPPLGAAGAVARRPGPWAPLALLVAPAGAALQMALLPPPADSRMAQPVRWTVWLAAAAGAVLIVRASARRRRAQADATEPSRAGR